jgi:hypothetical protein
VLRGGQGSSTTGWITDEYDDASLAAMGPAGVLREALEIRVRLRRTT